MALIHSFNHNLSSVKDNDDLGSTSRLVFFNLENLFQMVKLKFRPREEIIKKKKASYMNLVLTFHKVV